MIKQGIYKHYKGNLYEVIAVARHSETLEELVVYKPLSGEGACWVRPLSMWDTVIAAGEGYVKRFEFVSDFETD